MNLFGLSFYLEQQHDAIKLEADKNAAEVASPPDTETLRGSQTSGEDEQTE